MKGFPSAAAATAALGALLLVAAWPSAAQTPGADGTPLAAAYGQAGTPRFVPYAIPEGLPGAHDAAEPTIGIPWNTDHAFFQAGSKTLRAAFTNGTAGGDDNVTWDDVSPAFTLINVDPMLHADPITGRIFAGGLLGPCSLMGMSDDDGATWLPVGNMCSGPQFDHQSIGSGAWSTTAPESVGREAVYPRAVYYCAQLTRTACATSLDGGRAWLPFTEVLGGCGGLHGHIDVSEATGMAAVPHGSCADAEGVPLGDGDLVGVAYTKDNGVTWDSLVMPDSVDGNGFDPAVAFSRESGWMWVAQADSRGIHVALSKDEGESWVELGNATAGATPSTWLDLNTTFTDPRTGHPLVYGAFADLEAGDDERVALAYLGTTDPNGSHPFDDCSDESAQNIWHYYLSVSYDGGATWTTSRLWEDPVQVGAIWNLGGGASCRNLLDFNDMEMDSKGRLHIAFADGCTDACAEKYDAWVRGAGEPPGPGDSRDDLGVILRQQTGLGMMSEFDGPAPPPAPPVQPTAPPKKDTPGAGLAALLAALAVAAVALRRR